MAIEDVLSRISAIQARFGVSGFATGTSEFEAVLSDAARHAGIAPTDRIDEPSADEVATADETDAAASDGPGSGRLTSDEPASAPEVDADGTSPAQADTAAPEPTAGADAATDVVAVLDDLGVTSGVRSGEAMEADVVAVLDDLGVTSGVRSGEAMEALAAAASPALTTAAALGGTGSASLLDTLTDQLGSDGGAAVLASIIAQQQAGAGIVRETGS